MRTVHDDTTLRTRTRWRRQLLVFTGMLALLSGPASGTDVLVGRGGERLPGKLLAQDAEWIEFDSELLGRIRVPASRARVEPASPGPVKAEADEAAALESPPQDPVLSASADALEHKAPSAIEATLTDSPAAQAKATWTRQLGLSGRKDSGTDETQVDEIELNYRLSRSLEPHRSFLEATYRFKRENDLAKDDDWRLRLRHEYEFSERRFRAVQLTDFSQLEDNGRRRVRVLSAVTGWRLADGERLKFSVAPGYALSRGSDPESRVSSHGPVIFTSWDWLAYRDFRLSGVVTFLSPLGNADQYVMETDMRLDWPITEHLGVALSWDYQRKEYDEFSPGSYSRLRWLLTWKP
jgi:hypothetical protein